MRVNKSKIASNIIFYIILAIATLVSYRLFYLQAINIDHPDRLFFSDMRAYMQEILGEESGYSFPYPIFFWIGRLFYFICSDIAVAIALDTTLLTLLAMLFCKLDFDWILDDTFADRNFLQRLLSDIVVLGLFFVSMIFDQGLADAGYPFTYLGAFTPNPWQNATYFATRPFMILAFFFSIRIVQIYEEGFQKKYIKDYLLFAGSLLLTTMTKPSYTLVHLCTMLAFFVTKLIVSRFSLFKQTLTVVIYYIPTLIAMLYQYSGVFTAADPGEETGVGIGFLAVWSSYSSNIFLSIIAAAAFPLLVFIFNFYSKRKDTTFVIAWLTYLMGFLTSALLYEKGARMGHFNFAWGYMGGLFIVFMASALVMLENCYDRKWFKFIPEIIVFAIQLFCGVRYFYMLSLGHSYYEHLSLFW